MATTETPARYSTVTYVSHRGTETGRVSGYNFSGYSSTPESYNLTNGEVVYPHQVTQVTALVDEVYLPDYSRDTRV